MRLRKLAAWAAVAMSGSASAQLAGTAPDYSDDANWLCLPGRADPCGTPLATTALNANGYGSVAQSVPAKDAPVDCFYVYPTVSRDEGANSDLAPGMEEKAAAMTQFARFSSVCRPFAPVYRQVTLAALQSTMAGKPMGDMAIAYADVLAAWRQFLANRNQNRPFAIIGHSQGTIMLSQLLAREIEGSSVASWMLSAILIGYNVEVPEGQKVGGTFKRTPLCSAVGETGCVITFVSFRATNPPPAGSLFARAVTPGMTVGCTNPARFRRETTPLDSYWFANPATNAITWSTSGKPVTPFVRTEGLASAACVARGNLGYLSVTVNGDPADARTDEIPGDVNIGGNIVPGWGLHLADMSLAQGDLISLLQEQADALRRRK